MAWLVLLPVILGCVVVLTDMAISALTKAVAPQVCDHPFRMYGRCGKCGTPM